MNDEAVIKKNTMEEIQQHHQQIIKDLLESNQHLSADICIEKQISPLRTPNDLYEQSMQQYLKKQDEDVKETTEPKES